MIDSKKLVEELEKATEWLARDYYQECHSAARLIRKLESENAALKARVAELERWVDCGQDGPCAKSPGCNRHWEERNGELVREVRALQSQLAWTPVSKGLPTEPGWYVFHGAEREPELLYGADTGRYSFWVGVSKTYDMEEMSHFYDYRRIELPKDGET